MAPEHADETLDIENFLSIKEFHWDIKHFNIITGDMGSGKSLCIKLLYFFEGIFVSSILLAPGFSKKIFENGNFFERLSEKFKKIFYLDDNNCQGLKITYRCKINGSDFTISVAWDDQKEKLQWESDYLRKKMPEWAGYFTSPDTPDMVRIVRNQIHDEIKHDFKEMLPITCMFVPASRAALAVVGSNTEFKDPYLKDFARDKDFLLSYPDISLSSESADILKVSNIKKNLNDEADVILEHEDGRTVPTLFSSSGQQELVYLLLLLEKLPEIRFNYGGMLSIFIEEPSAHLFPKEQKELIERIVSLFQKRKVLETRFFITTHSPYVLNVLNNMLKKGNIMDKIEKNKERVKELKEKFDFPSLFAREVSASFIEEKKGTNMLDPKSGIIFADKIDEIAELIDKDTQELIDFDYELEAN
jgi:ABC-type lipoprotein export system ATPase subunit